MVRAAAKSLCRDGSYADRMLLFADLESVGRIGVLNAIQRFDPERGAKFQTAVLYSIRGAILRFINTDCHPGLAYRHSSNRRYALAARHTKAKGFKPLDDEDEPMVQEIASQELREEIDYALGCLDPELATIIRMRFGLDGQEAMKYKDIAPHFQVTPERIRQRCYAAMNSLGNILKARGITAGDIAQ